VPKRRCKRRGSTGRVRLAVLVVIAALGVSAPVASAFNGTLRQSTANPRYFTDNSGKPILLTGSHTWSDLQDWGDSSPTPTFNYTSWLDLMQNNGQDFFRLWSWEHTRYIPWTTGDFRFTMNGAGTGVNANSGSPWNRSATVCCAADGGNKFDLNISGTLFNQGYFDRLAARVSAASARGIYVGVMLFQGWSIDNTGKGSGNPWNGHPFNSANNVNSINGDTNADGNGAETHTINASDPNINAINNLQKAYIRKVVDTVNSYDNVLYEITNEDRSTTADTAWQNAMIDYIKSYEATKAKQHPVGMTAQYPNGNNADLFASHADWVSPSMNYSTDSPATGNKVVLSDTDHIYGYGGDSTWVWETFLRGTNPLWMDLGEDVLPPSVSGQFPVPSNASENVIRSALGEVKTYADKVDLSTVVPHGELASTGHAMADPGNKYLVFQPASSTAFTVTLAAGTYDYEWLNVVANTTSTGSVTAAGGAQSFTAPFSGTAVLYLKRTSAPPAGTFVKGINLNGGAVTIEGHAWSSYASALTSGFSTNAPSSGTASLPSLDPSTDADTRTMLESVLYRSSPPNGQGFRMSQTIANGTYQVYFWVVENYMSNNRDIDVKLEGATVDTAIADQAYQHWHKYGPYPVTVSDGTLDMDLLRHSKGDPEVSGLAIYSPSSGPTFVKGINLNGAATTIGGNSWTSYASALTSGFSTTSASTGTATLPTSVDPDANTRSMLESVIYRSSVANGQGFTMNQTIANGTYQVYLSIVENYMSNFRDMDIKVEGTTVATAIGDQAYAHWQRYGPYTATVSDGSLSVDVLRHTKGDPVVSGIEIYTP